MRTLVVLLAVCAFAQSAPSVAKNQRAVIEENDGGLQGVLIWPRDQAINDQGHMQSSIFWPRDQSVDDQGQMQSSVYWERDQAAGGQGQSFQGGPSWPSELTNQGNMSNEGHMQGAHAWSRGEGGNSGHFQSGIFWSVPQYGQPVEPATGGYLFKDNESDQIKHVEPIQHDTYEQNSGKGRQVNNLVSSRDQRPHYQSNSDEALNEIQGESE